MVDVACEFTPDGRHRGDVRLYHDGVEVGSGHVPFTTPITFGLVGFSVGHQRGSAITPAYRTPFTFTPGALGKVLVDVAGRPWQDPVAEFEARLAMQ